MKGFAIASTAVALASSALAQSTVDPIVIKGQKFFYKTNGTQFFIKGVAYQQDVTANGSSSTSTQYTDPLADEAGCTRDIPILKQLHTNTIRVYAIDPTKDHSACMNMLAANDIYVVSDLSQPGLSIDRSDPQWNDELYSRYVSVVDSLANYTNTLGFFAGNEVSNAPNNTDASAFVKAAVRDTKAYIKAKGYRPIGVGYATNDDASIRTDMADYFNCGDPASAIDFWGYNIYSWCGDSSYSESGYQDRTEAFQNYSVPAFFAEYGCNTQGTRKFEESAALYGDQMTPVWSGGIVYMYFQEANNYGLVSVDGNTVSKLPDFSNLQSRLATLTPTGVNSASYSPTNSPQACPSEVSSVWDAKASPLPPSPNQELCSCMYDSLSCVVKSSVGEDAYGDIFGYICGLNGGSYCNGIDAYGNNATYGAYSMCNSTEQLAYVVNAYVNAQTGSVKASACDFSGSATSKPTSTASGCSSLLQQAGTAGTGVVTSSPTATGAGAGGGSGSGSGSGASASATSKGAAAGLTIPSFDFGLLNLGIYLFGATLSGAAMILL